jgi:hypothetical protein
MTTSEFNVWNLMLLSPFLRGDRSILDGYSRRKLGYRTWDVVFDLPWASLSANIAA